MEQTTQHLTLTIPTGSPEDLCVFSHNLYDLKGRFFARNRLDLLGSQSQDDLGTGVYILWRDADDTEPRPQVYVGEGNVLARLNDHKQKKDFWVRGAAFSKMDLGPAKYLEAQLYQLVQNADRCKLDNRNVPRPHDLSDPDKQKSSIHLDFIRLCMRIQGNRFFEPGPSLPPQDGSPSSGNLRLRGPKDKVEATAYESPDGFVVVKGATMAKKEKSSLQNGLRARRKLLLDDGVMEERDGVYVLTRDFTFRSPSRCCRRVAGAVSIRAGGMEVRVR